MKTPFFFNNTRDYWRFYWPLASLAFISLLGTQLQVMVLARYGDGVRELANLAVAGSIFMLFYSSLIFIPQLTNVYSDSKGSRRSVFRFVVVGSAVLTCGFALVSWTQWGQWLIGTLFSRQNAELPLADIQLYCRWLTPVLLLEGLRAYYMGLLIQNRKTGIVSLLNLISLLLIAVILFTGYRWGWTAPTVVGGSQLFSAALTLLLAWWVYKCRYYQAEPTDPIVPDWKELWRFFIPVALTGFFFAVSRPILIAFAGRTEDPEILIAVSRVAFEISFFLIAPMNQFRNLYVTFGKTDLAGVRDFSILVMVIVMTLMLLVLITPLSGIVFGDIYGLKEPLYGMVKASVWVLVLLPIILTARNYYHGLCMVRKTTGNMGIAGFFRMGALVLGAWACTAWGLFNQWTLPLILILGFVVETLMIAWRVRRQHIPS